MAISGTMLILDVIACVLLLAFALRQSSGQRRLGEWHYLLLAVGLCVLGGAAFGRKQQEDRVAVESLPRQATGDEFVSSDACRKCHPNHYASWHDTFHRTMTQVVTPETVVAPFDNVELTSRGRTYRLERRGDEFWVQASDSDWTSLVQGATPGSPGRPPMVERRVVMSTGSHHMQEYWLANPLGDQGATLIQVPFAYHFDLQRWIPLEDIFLQPDVRVPGPKLWNNTCIQCHSTAGSPGFDQRTGRVQSEVAEFGIACEACHGPGVEHVRFHSNPLQRYGQHLRDEPDETIINPANCSPREASQICGQCHSTFDALAPHEFMSQGFSYRAGRDLEESRRILRYDDRPEAELEQHFYWQDGTCRVGGDEYLGLIESACYQRGELSCLSCHSMHDSDANDQLAEGMRTNQACLKCHSAYADNIEQHTRHGAESSGSQCYNCHMPHISFALFTAMRSHRVDSPDVASSARTGRPNACNLCHLDKSLAWTAEHLNDWYGAPHAELSEDQRKTSAALLWLLRGDAAQRAVAAWHVGWAPARDAAGDGWQAPFVAQLLKDPYAMVRYLAGQALQQLPGFEDFAYDFIAPPNERVAAVQRAVGQWEARGYQPQDAAQQILLGPTGELQLPEVERLLEQRDDRDVHILE